MKFNPYRAGLVLVLISNLCGAKPVLAQDAGYGKNDQLLTLRSLERTSSEKKEVSWLGVAVEEASEALQAQLGLKTGEGLVVTMVASNSPAFSAGLHKFDVLTELDGQMLVDPVQLRKLVQMHSQGEDIHLDVYRGGKKMSVSAKLTTTTWDDAALDGGGGTGNFNIDMKGLKNLTRNLNVDLAPEIRNAAEDQKKMAMDFKRAAEQERRAGDEVKRAMEEARRDLERAMKEHPDHAQTLGSEDKDMTDLADKGISVDTDTSIVVKKDLKFAKSIVTTDDTGVYIIVADPVKRLTARDHEGKVLFDGEVETPEQQAKVPKNVWEKVKPMIDQLGTVRTDKPESRAVADKSNS